MHLGPSSPSRPPAVASVVNTAVAPTRASLFSTTATTPTCRSWRGPGAVGLGLWLAVAAAGPFLAAGRALRATAGPEPFVGLPRFVLLPLYGVFQGHGVHPGDLLPPPGPDRYTTNARPAASAARRTSRGSLWPSRLVLVSDRRVRRGPRLREPQATASRSRPIFPTRRRSSRGSIAPTGPSAEFRWMSRRGIVNVHRRPPPFRSVDHLHHPRRRERPRDALPELRGADAGAVVFRRPGEKRSSGDSTSARPAPCGSACPAPSGPAGRIGARSAVGQRDPWE